MQEELPGPQSALQDPKRLEYMRLALDLVRPKGPLEILQLMRLGRASLGLR